MKTKQYLEKPPKLFHSPKETSEINWYQVDNYSGGRIFCCWMVLVKIESDPYVWNGLIYAWLKIYLNIEDTKISFIEAQKQVIKLLIMVFQIFWVETNQLLAYLHFQITCTPVFLWPWLTYIKSPGSFRVKKQQVNWQISSCFLS